VALPVVLHSRVYDGSSYFNRDQEERKRLRRGKDRIQYAEQTIVFKEAGTKKTVSGAGEKNMGKCHCYHLPRIKCNTESCRCVLPSFGVHMHLGFANILVL
jgi:hypothetical protein